MVGAGWEQALTNGLSAKIEYNYLDFGSHTDSLVTTGGLVATPTDVRLYTHQFKIGLNQRLVHSGSPDFC
jgi:opacity protein-like surface antigen